MNTVNTEGVMGKGIALQFKQAYPEMFKAYQKEAKSGHLSLGSMHVWESGMLEGPRYVINFPTKGHWRSRSKLSDVRAGLIDLVRVIRELNIKSIAVPPLGCGNGGLDWRDVEPIIRQALEGLTDVEVLLYPPAGAPEPKAMPRAGASPRMTSGRAALVGVIQKYMDQSLNAPSLIEAQKLMYFLQVDGEPLRLKFEANRYGPYADNLRHVLAQVEGYFLTGFGDGSARVLEGVPLRPLEEGISKAKSSLADHPDTVERMHDVLRLVDGFESAYGLELLATVHWLASQKPAEDDAEIARRVADWSPRKSRMFTAEHVQLALNTLREENWLTKSLA
ncbi:macro domain-containing protein [Curtobacterium sp. MCLR17_040]|uniref:type II toxin-antitoxin system antitoxin DNA ADP-ribosyl glycohydrolase DarG n=1 Tax=Curtobacterium sp. MCLR17_040 TaxID=2175625 RepID=UPI001C650A1A|nr:macro domain-containing protein [Curtobacterium sp. MCLR17_040]